MYLLAYIGVISMALWVGNAAMRKLTVALRNKLLRSTVRFGFPIFVFTTLFNWVFPSHITFGEHIGLNLVLALLASGAWKHESTIEAASAE